MERYHLANLGVAQHAIICESRSSSCLALIRLGCQMVEGESLGNLPDIVTAVVFGLLAAVLLFVLAPEPMFLYPDTRGYLDVARGITTGEFWTTPANSQLSFSWAVRTPLYPLLLSLASSFGDDFSRSLRLLHAGMGGIAAAILVLVAPLGRSLFGRAIAGGVFLFCTLSVVGEDFRSALTEWVAYSLLVLLVALCYHWMTSKRVSGIASLATVASLAALARPVLIVAMIVPSLLILGSGRRELKRGCVAVLSGSVLLIAWFAFNTYRFGSPSLSPFLGHNLIGIAGFLPAPEQEDLPPGPVREFGAMFAAQRITPLELQTPFPSSTDAGRVLDVYNRNIHVIAATIASQMQLSVEVADRVYLRYSWQAIWGAPGVYVSYVRYTLTQFLVRSQMGLAGACVALLLCLLLRLRSHGVALGACLVIHLAVILSTSLVETFLERYTRVTLGCCWLFSVLGLLACCAEFERRWRGAAAVTPRESPAP